MVGLSRMVATLLISAMLSSCLSLTTQVNPDPQTDGLPSTTKKTLHAGVYYDPQFKSFEQARLSGTNTIVAPIGKASAKLFDELVSRVFEKSTRLSELSTDEIEAKGVDLVISPSLVHFDFRLGMDADSDRYSVGYRTTLYSAEGVPVASWVVVGNAVSATGLSSSLRRWLEDDMKDAAAKFLQDFEHNAGPALAAIARRAQGQGAPVEQSSVSLAARRGSLPGLEPETAKALRDAGLVAIQVTLRGATQRKLVVRASDMRLRLADGSTIVPATVNSVLSRLDKSSNSGEIAAFFAGALVGLLVSTSERRAQQEGREGQYRKVVQSLFRDRTIDGSNEEAGLVPFLIPEGAASAGRPVLTAWVVDPDAATGAQIEVPLAD